MKLLRSIWTMLTELSGDADYRKYCAHLRARHPDREVPTAKQFFLARLEEKYRRPSRCC